MFAFDFLIQGTVAFAAGFLSFLSPCTLPVLPAYFAFAFQAERKRIALMTLSFFLGLATIFVLMGASAFLVGSILKEYLDLFTTIGGVLIIAFGLMVLIGKGFTGLKSLKKPSATFGGTFFFGSAFALGWTPCVGPILTSILLLAATAQTLIRGMILLFLYALGLGMPLIIVSTFFGRMGEESSFWRFLRGKGWEFTVLGRVIHLHTTNLISGLLLVGLGILLSTGYLTILNRYIPANLQVWFLSLEKKLMHFFPKR